MVAGVFGLTGQPAPQHVGKDLFQEAGAAQIRSQGMEEMIARERTLKREHVSMTMHALVNIISIVSSFQNSFFLIFYW